MTKLCSSALRLLTVENFDFRNFQQNIFFSRYKFWSFDVFKAFFRKNTFFSILSPETPDLARIFFLLFLPGYFF
jgi:hypothetical protein